MDETAFKTLADVILDHQDGLKAGEALLDRQVANDRRLREGYNLIREALDRDGMKGVALVDDATSRVYFLNNGLVAYMPFAWSRDVDLDQESTPDPDHDSLVALGETS
jgi:hypothetical protein